MKPRVRNQYGRPLLYVSKSLLSNFSLISELLSARAQIRALNFVICDKFKNEVCFNQQSVVVYASYAIIEKRAFIHSETSKDDIFIRKTEITYENQETSG